MGRVAAISAADSAMATASAHSGCSWAGRLAIGARAGGAGGGWVRRIPPILGPPANRPLTAARGGAPVRSGPVAEPLQAVQDQVEGELELELVVAALTDHRRLVVGDGDHQLGDV